MIKGTFIEMVDHFEKIESCLNSTKSQLQIESIQAMIHTFEHRWSNLFKNEVHVLSCVLNRKLCRL